MTPGDVKLLWCRGKWITRKTSSGCFGRMIEGEKKPCFFFKTSDIYNIKELCLRLFKTFLPAASIGRYLSFASCARF